MKKIFNINRYDMFWYVIIWIVLAFNCCSCERVEMRESCTYSSKPPFYPASIVDPSEENLEAFKRDWGNDLKVECVKKIDS